MRQAYEKRHQRVQGDAARAEAYHHHRDEGCAGEHWYIEIEKEPRGNPLGEVFASEKKRCRFQVLQMKSAGISPSRACPPAVSHTMGPAVTPTSGHRAEHVSLLGWQLEPESGRTARVTPQSAVPVATFLSCAALFFTSCVAVLVVGARPSGVPGSARVVPMSSLQAHREYPYQRGSGLDAGYDQLVSVKIDGAPSDSGLGSLMPTPIPENFQVWRGAAYWRFFSEMPVAFSEGSEEMVTEPLVVIAHDDGTTRNVDTKRRTRAWLASVEKNALPHAISGRGTNFRGGEDRTLGLKASLLRLRQDNSATSHDPVVVWSDVNDSPLFSCGAKGIADSFAQSGAEIVVTPGQRSGKGNTLRGRVVVGRASHLMELVRKYEAFILERGDGALSCAGNREDASFDDQLCLDRYVQEAVRGGKTKVVVQALACIVAH